MSGIVFRRAKTAIRTGEKGESKALEQKHDYSRKSVSTPGSSPGAGFFGIML
jgi:hypothetical protein